MTPLAMFGQFPYPARTSNSSGRARSSRNGAAFLLENTQGGDTMGTSDSSQDRPDQSAARVLVVDDEKLILKLCRRILEREGYRIHTAQTATRAVERVREASFDIVMCDISMPRLQGDELVDEIRQIQPGLGVLFCSGHPLDSPALSHVDLGDDAAFLQKPFVAGDLVEAVERLVG